MGHEGRHGDFPLMCNTTHAPPRPAPQVIKVWSTRSLVCLHTLMEPSEGMGPLLLSAFLFDSRGRRIITATKVLELTPVGLLPAPTAHASLRAALRMHPETPTHDTFTQNTSNTHPAPCSTFGMPGSPTTSPTTLPS